MIYLTGDCHGDFTKLFNLKNKLNNNDYVIILGDFGYWNKSQTNIFDKIEIKLNFNILFIDGNHSNFSLLNALPIYKWNDGYVHYIRKNIIHLMRGNVFNIEYKKFFTFGGAKSIDKEFRIENKSWWKEELPNENEIHYGLNMLEENNFNVDYILTHDCPTNILNKIDTSYKPSVLNNYFNMISESTKFKHWYFGHYHINQQINKYTCLYDNIIKIK